MKKIAAFVVSATIAMGLVSPGPARGEERTYGDAQGIIVGNYDGDTLTVNLPDYPPILGERIHVRVRHIDTPEIKSHDPRALQAKQFVAAMCPTGSLVILREMGRDMYFRIDADVECGGKDVGTALVNAGLAHGGYEGGHKEAW